jgi:hypothetical protein
VLRKIDRYQNGVFLLFGMHTNILPLCDIR